jgi:uncharacterized membrane protein YdfJ with MMPL/SSD domain
VPGWSPQRAPVSIGRMLTRFSPTSIGRWSTRRPRLAIAAWLAFVLAAVLVLPHRQQAARLPQSPDDHRRVRAVITYLNSQ